MGTESSARFLASHSPIAHVKVGTSEETITDGQVFERISRLRARESVVYIHGAPGTGKSHLINWIKLRYDHEIETGQLKHVLPVLIQRRTGSLKDALEQLVQQLPDGFAKYLDPIRVAIANISEAAARQKLASELCLELGIKWDEQNLPPHPRTIRDIAEAFRAEGFAGCRRHPAPCARGACWRARF
jgi:hypothetical protein